MSAPVLTDEAEIERMGRVLDEIALERRRQERKGMEHRARGQEHWRSCADPLLPTERKLAILVEEVGEAAKALNEEWVGNPANLREELIHVAAVAVAWAESLTELPSFASSPLRQEPGDE
jgi:NTP pyrophosphatase (non-canonical NTP hydrolase)